MKIRVTCPIDILKSSHKYSTALGLKIDNTVNSQNLYIVHVNSQDLGLGWTLTSSLFNGMHNQNAFHGLGIRARKSAPK